MCMCVHTCCAAWSGHSSVEPFKGGKWEISPMTGHSTGLGPGRNGHTKVSLQPGLFSTNYTVTCPGHLHAANITREWPVMPCPLPAHPFGKHPPGQPGDPSQLLTQLTLESASWHGLSSALWPSVAPKLTDRSSRKSES